MCVCVYVCVHVCLCVCVKSNEADQLSRSYYKVKKYKKEKNKLNDTILQSTKFGL